MSELLALGISHKTAPVALRERVALTEGRAESFLRELVADAEVHEAVAISTCNRTEIYLVVVYVAIIGAKIGRIERELEELNDLVDDR